MKLNIFKNYLRPVALSLALALTGAISSAQIILIGTNVNDGSFESITAKHNFSSPTSPNINIPFWGATLLDTSGNVVAAPSDSGAEFNGNHQQGLAAAYLQPAPNSTIFNLATNYIIQAGDVFTLTWWARVPSGVSGQVTTFYSQAPGTVGATWTYQPTATLTNVTGGDYVGTGSFKKYTLTYTATASDAGNYIGLTYGHSAGGYIDFDDFRLSVVPNNTQFPIVMTTQPISQRVLTNTVTTFTVASSGSPIFAQWYKISGGTTNGISNATNLSYTIPPVLETDSGTGYFVILTNSISRVTSSVAVVTAGHYIGPVAGFLEADQYTGFGDQTTTMETFYPGSTYGTTNTPFKTEYLTQLNDNQDVPSSGAEQIYGWFTPAVTGNYIFYVASDDACSLWLSTNSSPANSYEIAQCTTWMYYSDWNLTQSGSAEASTGANAHGEIRSDSFELNGGNLGNNYAAAIFLSWSAWPGLNGDGSITLTAGTPYYIELDHWQGGGGQCAGVNYKLVGQPDPAYGSGTLISGGFLSTAHALDGGMVVITNQPADKTVQQNTSTTFAVVAGTYVVGAPAAIPPALEYQWQVKRSGASVFTNIPGAYSATYSTPLTTLANNGDQYRVMLTTLGYQTTSSAVTLTVQPDTIKPSISEIGATTQTISVTWNKLLDPTTALNSANYTVNGGVTVTSVTMTNMVAGAYAAATVRLTITGAVAGNSYNLTVNNVKDLSQLQTVAANTTVPFLAYNVFLDFNEGTNSFSPAVTNLNGLANLGLNSGYLGGGGTDLQIPSGGSGGFVINDTLSGAQVNNFLASFKLFVGPFPNNNNNNPGGYGNEVSFSFGPANQVFWGAPVVGSGAINGANVLAVSFTTTSGSSGVSLYYAGVLVTNVPIADNTVLVNAKWVDVTIALNSDGTVDVDHNGTQYIRHVALPSYTPVSAGNILFRASSGVNWQISTLDDISLLENATLPKPTLSITGSGANATISWIPAGGRLQTTGVLGGSWTDVPSSQPVQIPTTGTNAFFRVVVP